ncbi:MAG: glycine--tRNA ligase subunit beta, partial [Chlamydiae bacterium]|nr:glycine--tRNA ligase subunit beta [Chlamydiota bacterium]
VERLLHHVRILHTRMPLAEESTLLRAALLCKSDLASALVGEFPELQGVIGKYYAKAQGESEQVALAIEEHWMPKAESAPLPTSPCGAIVSLADKIDNLLGYFHVGLKPSSSSDPYALKRQTFGLLRILLEEKTSLNLKELLLECSRAFPSTVSETVMEEILVFITNRAKSLFEEMGCQKDAIEASLQGSCLDPYLQFCKIQALASFKKSEEFSRFYEVYKRVKGLLEGVPTSHADEALLVHPAEQELLQKLSSLRKQMHLFLEKKDFLSTFQALAQLQVPLSALLDQVKVQADDPLLRSSRIALIAQVFGLFAGLLDFSKIKEEEKICCPS